MKLVRYIIKLHKKLNDPLFISFLADDRRKFQVLGLILLGVVQPLYILIDKSMFPSIWGQWNFLGVRLVVACLALTVLATKRLRYNDISLKLLGFIFMFGLALMFNSYPFDSLTEAYQGASMMMIGMSLIVFSSLNFFFIYSMLTYSVFYLIWLFTPPPSFELWLTDGGFSNFTITWIVSNCFYTLRLYLLHKNYILVQKLEQKTHEVEQKASELNTIVKSMPQGVLLITRDMDGIAFALDQNTSSALKELMKYDFKGGEDPFEHIFDKSSLSRDEVAKIKNVLDSALGANQIQWEVNIKALPREFTIQHESSPLLIEADWTGIFDEYDELEKVLVTLKDVTEVRKLRQELDQTNLEASLISEIIKNTPHRLKDFLIVANLSAKECLEIISEDLKEEKIYQIMRNLHTLKGLSRNYKLKKLSSLIHDIEGDVQRHARESEINGKAVSHLIETLFEFIEQYRKLYAKLFLSSKEKSNISSINDAELKATIDRILCLLRRNLTQEAKETLESLYHKLEFNLARTIADEINMAKDVAKRLEKLPPNIILRNDLYEIPLHLRAPIRKIFVHLLRNAIDHGIEKVEERINKSKAVAGTIVADIKIDAGWIEMKCSDDGAGFDLNKIYQSAHKTKHPLGKLAKNNKEGILNLIFLPNVSTAAKITDISGRGVGLDAVKNFIEELGGDIKLIPEDQQDDDNMIKAYFRLRIPLQQPSKFEASPSEKIKA
ncbi:MAG: ATP-binding protein [Oligoflexus sp.]